MSSLLSLFRRLPGGAAKRLRARRQLAKYRRLYPGGQAAREHGLSAELVVSLTSYRPRFATLACTLSSLFSQSVKPDRVVLWIAEAERAELPPDVTSIPDLQIEFVEDLRSYKKLVFALERFPDAFIATCDDDTFYPPTWLEELVDGYDPKAPTITCHRAHRVPAVSSGRIPPYLSWEWDVQDAAARRPSADLMPTGVGGVLYYPGCLHPAVTDRKLFIELCPDADDLWFFWQARRAGSLYRKVGDRFGLNNWEGTQEQRLFNSNDHGNDRQIERLLDCFGVPNSPPARECSRASGERRGTPSVVM